MRNRYLYRLVTVAALATMVIIACGGDSSNSPGLSSAKAITAFSITNPAATGTIDENAKTISVTLPYGTNVTALAATFITTGTTVKVGSMVQVSGTTPNDFTNQVAYIVTAVDNSTAIYTVTVTVAPSSAKAITAFSFTSLAATGTIDENAKTISVTVPYGTNVTVLVATFTTTGASVKVGSTVQVSGTTPNDFANPVAYIVAAADSSTETYTVTVTTGGGVALTSLAISPQTTALESGSTQQFTVMGKYSDNSTKNLTSSATWTTLNASVATVNAAGHVAAASNGSTTISAVYSGYSVSAPVKVVPGFASAVHAASKPADNWLGSIAVGDLNNDGLKDIVAIEAFYKSRILLYAEINGSVFSPSLLVTTELQLKGVSSADINNDGFADLIVSGNSTTVMSGPKGRIGILYQDAVTHALSNPVYIALSSYAVGPVVVADLNGDDLPDIVAAGQDASYNGVVSFLFQAGGGMLASEITYTHLKVVLDRELHVADMNNDGMNDIVLHSGSAQFAVIKQTGAGTFSTTPELYTVQTKYASFRSFALGDLNNDGLTDVVVADSGNDGLLNIFLQDSSGMLTGPFFRYVFYNTQDEVDIADMDGDGLNDLVVRSGGDQLYFLYQMADHSFAGPLLRFLPTATVGGNMEHQAVVVEDIDGDGLPDVAASWYREGIYLLPRKP